MKLEVSGTARAEIARIADHIANENPRAALRLTGQFRRRFREIAERPRASPLLRGFEEHQIRRKVHGNYLIFFRVNSDRIEVIHVLHGAMDYASILAEGG